LIHFYKRNNGKNHLVAQYCDGFTVLELFTTNKD